MKLIKARTPKVFLSYNGWVSTVMMEKNQFSVEKPEFFSGLIHYYLSCVYYCDDQSCLHICLCYTGIQMNCYAILYKHL